MREMTINGEVYNVVREQIDNISFMIVSDKDGNEFFNIAEGLIPFNHRGVEGD